MTIRCGLGLQFLASAPNHTVEEEGRSLAQGCWGGVGAEAQDLPPMAVASAEAGARPWSLFLAMDTGIGRKG